MFRGRFNHTIDPKGRLSIPSKFRDLLRDGLGDNLVIVPNESCVQVYPLQEWEVLEGKVASSSPLDVEVRKFSLLFISRARDTSIDQAGRILIPPEFRSQVGLHKEVTVVGGGLRLFEVWDRARFEQYELAHQHELPTLFGTMSGRGA